MRPWIGISCWQHPENLEFFVPEAYVQSVRGVDIDPLHWGEEPLRQMGRIDPSRDASELALASRALSGGTPVLGICGGVQMLAVAGGGSLWQDLPSQVPGSLKHDQNAPRWYPTHTARLVPGSQLASWFGGEVRVNSYHHQAVRDVPPAFVVTASAPDGVIEALEHQSHPFAVGVQWHPETMWNHDQNFDQLFRAFVQAAEAGASARRRALTGTAGAAQGGAAH